MLKLDLMYDDVALNVTRVTERGQWDVVGDDTAPLVEHEHQLQHMQQEQQGQARSSDSGWEMEGCGGEEGVVQRLPHECHARREVLGSELPVERIHALSQVGRFTKVRDTGPGVDVFPNFGTCNRSDGAPLHCKSGPQWWTLHLATAL